MPNTNSRRDYHSKRFPYSFPNRIDNWNPNRNDHPERDSDSLGNTIRFRQWNSVTDAVLRR